MASKFLPILGGSLSEDALEEIDSDPQYGIDMLKSYSVGYPSIADIEEEFELLGTYLDEY